LRGEFYFAIVEVLWMELAIIKCQTMLANLHEVFLF